MPDPFAKRFKRRRSTSASAGEKGEQEVDVRIRADQFPGMLGQENDFDISHPAHDGHDPVIEIDHVSAQAQGGGHPKTGCEEKSQKTRRWKLFAAFGRVVSLPFRAWSIPNRGGLNAAPADRLSGAVCNWLKTNWLPRMDSNHDKVIQNHLCYRYTTRQYFMSELKLTGKVLTGFPSSGLPPVALGGSEYRPRN